MHMLHPSLQQLGWERPRPTVLPATADEWQWPPVGPHLGLLWDSTMAACDSSVEVSWSKKDPPPTCDCGLRMVYCSSPWHSVGSW